MTAPTEEAQKLGTDPIVALFRFDATKVGGQVLYFCQAAFENAEVSFGGVTYTPVDCQLKGMETNVGGPLPQPTLRLASTNGVFHSLVNTYGDMLGCDVRRIRTYRKYLDGQPSADPSKYFGPDVFVVARKMEDHPAYIEWKLSPAIDQKSKYLPGRQVIRDTCGWRYRRFDNASGTFDYSMAQCPYAGSALFDRSGNPVTDPAADLCGRKLSDCEKRFGEGNPLPFGGFPGVARVRPR